MNLKTLLGSLTAGVIAVGALTATTGTAVAAGPQSFGYGYQAGSQDLLQYVHGPRRQFRRQARRNRDCRPVFRKVMWRDHYGRPHWKRVKVGVTCAPRRQHDSYGYGYRGPGFSFRFGW